MANTLGTPERSRRRQRLLLLFMLAWTGLVALALWWLLGVGPHQGGGATWVYHAGDLMQQSWSERARDWFRMVHLNFQRIYPWVLFGPYVLLLAACFPLERGRFKQCLLLHLLGSAAFVGAAYAINSHGGMTVARVVVFNSNRQVSGQPEQVTNQVRVELSTAQGGEVIHEEATLHHAGTSAANPSLPDILRFRQGDHGDQDITNLLGKLGHGLGPPLAHTGFPTMRPLTTVLDLLAYWALVGVAHSLHFYRRYRERERQALHLESSLAKARLSALQAQLQPHFLFNSLNAIVTLLRRDPHAAEATLTSLSELLRITLSQSETQEVPLREELHFVKRYVEIQQTRFGDRLQFAQDVQPATLDCLVPTLLLQPLVENAIRHGIEPSEQAGEVRLDAWQEEARLVLMVHDNGAGMARAAKGRLPSKDLPEATLPAITPAKFARPGSTREAQSTTPSSSSRGGIGLANLRARLEALYGAEHKLELRAPPEGGFTVRVEIPFHAPRLVPEAHGRNGE